MQDWSKAVERLARLRNVSAGQQENFVFELTGQKCALESQIGMGDSSTYNSTEKQLMSGSFKSRKESAAGSNQHGNYITSSGGSSNKWQQLKLPPRGDMTQSRPNSSLKQREKAEGSGQRVLELSNYTYSKSGAQEPSDCTLRSLPASSHRSPGSVFGYFKRANTSYQKGSQMRHNSNDQEIEENHGDKNGPDLVTQGIMIRKELRSLGEKLRQNIQNQFLDHRMEEQRKCMILPEKSHEGGFNLLDTVKLERIDGTTDSEQSRVRRSRSIENSLSDIRESLQGIKQTLKTKGSCRDFNYVSVKACLENRGSSESICNSANSQYFLQKNSGEKWLYPSTGLETDCRYTSQPATNLENEISPNRGSTNDFLRRISVSKFNLKVDELGSTKESLFNKQDTTCGRKSDLLST